MIGSQRDAKDAPPALSSVSPRSAMFALGLALVALLLPPVLVQGFRRRPRVAALLDGLVLAAIVSLVALEVLPEAVHVGGIWALVGLTLGLLGPGMAERAGVRGHAVHSAGLVVGTFAIAVHSAVDGVALATAHGASDPLAVAVLLHQLPVGTAAWASARVRLGKLGGWATLLGMAAATTAGFLAGGEVVHAASLPLVGALTGLAGGTLLHVVVHEPLPGARASDDTAGVWGVHPSGIGALLALGALSGVHLLRGGGDEHAAVARALLEQAGRVGLGAAAGWVTVGAMRAWRGSVPRSAVLPVVLGIASSGLGVVNGLLLGAATLVSHLLQPRDEATSPAARTPREGMLHAMGEDAPALMTGLALAALVEVIAPPMSLSTSWVAALVLLQLPLAPVMLAPVAVALADQGMPAGIAVSMLACACALPGGLRRYARGQRGHLARMLVGGLLPAIALGAVHRWLPKPPASPNLATLLTGGLTLGALLGVDMLRRGPRSWLPTLPAEPEHDGHRHDHDHATSE